MPLTGAPLDKAVDITQLLSVGNQRDPDGTALVSAEMRWTWRTLEAATGRLAGNLLGRGLQPGDRVATLMPNRTALVIFYIACFKAGLVATPLNYRYTAREIDHALDISGAELLFSHAEREADWHASRLTGQLTHGILVYGAGDGSALRYEDLIEAKPASADLPVRAAADPGAIFFTSGSTGPAKGVTHTVATLGWMFAGAIEAFELTLDDVILPGSSMSHLGSFLWSLAGLSYGVKIVVPRSFEPDEILPLLRSERPSVMCMLPAALLRLVREDGATRDDFASIRLCRGGSDKVPAELEEEFERLTGHFIDEGYGMSEVGLAALNPPSGLIKIGSVGRPVPGYEMAIRDDDGNEVPVGTPAICS